MMARTIEIPISVRAYTVEAKPANNLLRRSFAGSRKIRKPSPYVLIFDTETTVDAAQKLRFGTYQVRKAGVLTEVGLFYSECGTTETERRILRTFAEKSGGKLLTDSEFIDSVFYPVAYSAQGMCVGFNLPFDLSRIAIGQSTAHSKAFRGGFSLKLTGNKYKPSIQVKHLNRRSSLIRFTLPARQLDPRGMRYRGIKSDRFRGNFVDVHTLACALLSGSWSLSQLSRHLAVEHPKLDTDEHGGKLTRQYIEYAVRDTQTTWECYEKLLEIYGRHGLDTQPTSIYSEASLGKSYLKQIGVVPWKDLQPDFPPDLLGAILCSYYGGRSEVRIRRKPVQVRYCDFLSMYPTACVLMGIWRFVTANGVTYEDRTAEVQRFVDTADIDTLRNPQSWQRLCSIVQVKPDGDLFPVRALYDGQQPSIGLNYLSSDTTLWYTLADCLASKVLTGRSPHVLRAIVFEPNEPQAGLNSMPLSGNQDIVIDPYADDFYKTLIEKRTSIKRQMRDAESSEERDRLNSQQLALKITANATCYGIFVETNVEESDRAEELLCYGPEGMPFSVFSRNVEKTGRYYHPLLSAVLTGAARLMLALAERLTLDEGMSWAFCDTDSLAIANLDNLPDDQFREKVNRVVDWFSSLSPYSFGGSLLKIEDANKPLPETPDSPLYCFAISAKRYALYNLDRAGKPVIRKASAHGLGHLLPPYTGKLPDFPEPSVPLKEIGVDRWQHDLWYAIICSALGLQNGVCLPAEYDSPAASRYAATTPILLSWFKQFNKGKPYSEQVKPNGFLLSFHGKSTSYLDNHPFGVPVSDGTLSKRQKAELTSLSQPQPIAPYNKDVKKAADHCFDRQSAEPVNATGLKSYREALARYELHPEAKFDNGDYMDSGLTCRRHVIATSVVHVGKEANHLEEQTYTGYDEDALISYGVSPDDVKRIYEEVMRGCVSCGQRALAAESGYSLREVSRIVKGHVKPTPQALRKLHDAIIAIQRERATRDAETAELLATVRQVCTRTGLRTFAAQVGIDHGNLTRILTGKRKATVKHLVALRENLASM